MKNDRRSSSRELACALLGACTASGGDTKALADRGNERGEGSAFPHARSRSRFDGSHDWKFESRTTQGLAGGGVWCSRFIRRASARCGCSRGSTSGPAVLRHRARPPPSRRVLRMRLLTMARHQKCWSFRSLLATGRPVLRLLESLFRCHGRPFGQDLIQSGSYLQGHPDTVARVGEEI